MLQGVRDVFELVELERAPPSNAGKIVFIGRGIAGLDFEGSLRGVLKEVGEGGGGGVGGV